MQKETQAHDTGSPAVENDAAEARRCAECGVKLSNYNPGPNCWQHTIGYPWRGPTAKPKF
jgi:hypothetical protein